ncbi:hypothetical protein ACPV5R_11115 [Vibrio astriarenae]
MMNYQVKKVRHPQYDGEHLPILVDVSNNNFPLPSASLWGWQLWFSHPLNTVYGRLRDLSVFYTYVDQHHPSFFEDAAKLKVLNTRQLMNLVSTLLVNYQYPIDAAVKVKPSTFNRRVDSIKLFLEFHYSRYISRLPNLEQADKAEKRVAKFLKNLVKKRYSSAEVENHTNPAKALSDHQVDLIKTIIRPSTDEFINEVNPYRLHLQRRNACALLLLLELGCRASELVLIKCNGDLKLTTNPTVIIKTADISTSSRFRSDGASHKTLGRELPISRELSELLLDYIEIDRPKLRRPHHGSLTEYLFVSDKDGGAMTTDGLKYIVDNLLRKTPNIQFVIHPHQLRVTRGILLRDSIDNQYDGSNSPMIKAGEMQDTLTTWGGWSATSTMPKRYTNELLQQKIRQYLADKGKA